MRLRPSSFLLTSLLSLLGSRSSAPLKETITVHVPFGSIRGLQEESTDGKRNKGVAFRGIPYAAQPTPRFQRSEAWQAGYPDGVWDATRAPPKCAQMSQQQESIIDAEDRPERQVVVGVEDCLYLNVYAPLPTSTGEATRQQHLRPGV